MSKETTFKKYDGETRARIDAFIIPRLNGGAATGAICAALKDAGFKKPDGSALDTAFVSGVCSRLRGKETINDRCPKTVAGILTDPTLNDRQKLSMLMAFYEIS